MDKQFADCLVYGYIPKFIFQAAYNHGVNRDELLNSLKMKPHELGSIEKSISLAFLNDIFERASELTKCPDIGLYAARIAYTNILKLQLHMSTICIDFREYLNLMPSVLKIFGDIGKFIISRDSTIIRMEWIPQFPEKMQSRYYSDFFLGLACLMVNSLCIRPISPNHSKLPYQQPEDSALIRDFFGKSIDYSNECCCLVFSSDVLDYKLVKLEYEQENRLDKTVSRLFEEKVVGDQFLVNLRRVVVRKLPNGQLNIDSIVSDLGTSRRSLQRHLAERNTNFTKILTDIRSQLSIRYLSDEQLSISDVAFLLEYVDQGAFTKVFKCWHGKTPRAYRQLYH